MESISHVRNLPRTTMSDVTLPPFLTGLREDLARHLHCDRVEERLQTCLEAPNCSDDYWLLFLFVTIMLLLQSVFSLLYSFNLCKGRKALSLLSSNYGRMGHLMAQLAARPMVIETLPPFPTDEVTSASQEPTFVTEPRSDEEPPKLFFVEGAPVNPSRFSTQKPPSKNLYPSLARLRE